MYMYVYIPTVHAVVQTVNIRVKQCAQDIATINQVHENIHVSNVHCD